MSDSTTRTLGALLSKLRQDEDAAGTSLARAVAAHAVATQSLAEAAARSEQAHASWQAAREASRVRAAISALAIAEAVGFAAARRDLWCAAVESQTQAANALQVRTHELAIAREALANARGEREAVENRLAAHVAMLERVAEAKVEEEAADRHAATRKRPR